MPSSCGPPAAADAAGIPEAQAAWRHLYLGAGRLAEHYKIYAAGPAVLGDTLPLLQPACVRLHASHMAIC